MFIADEIQSAMGRAGRWYAIEDEGVVPDLVTTAKSMGGGLPISAVTGRAEIMDAVHAGGLGGTYGGNPVAAAASLAVLDKIEREDLLARSRAGRRHDHGAVHARWPSRYDAIGDVRGRGAMLAIELVTDRGTKEPLGADTMNAIADGCLDQGVIVLTAGTYGNVVRLLPPITSMPRCSRTACRCWTTRWVPSAARNRHIAERLLPFRPWTRRRRTRPRRSGPFAVSGASLLDITPLRVSRDYRLLWTGTFISALGSQFARVGLYVQVYALTGSPAAVGLLGLSGLAGNIAGTFVGGSFIDAHDRRTVIVWTQVGHVARGRGAGRDGAGPVSVARGAARGERPHVDAWRRSTCPPARRRSLGSSATS